MGITNTFARANVRGNIEEPNTTEFKEGMSSGVLTAAAVYYYSFSSGCHAFLFSVVRYM